MATTSFEPAPAVGPFFAALVLLGAGVSLLLGGLALLEAGAAAWWAIVLVPAAVLCLGAAGAAAWRIVKPR